MELLNTLADVGFVAPLLAAGLLMLLARGGTEAALRWAIAFVLAAAATGLLKALLRGARILILGAGAAGLSAASRLAQRLDGAEVTLIDKRREHIYQPGFTLVAAGLKARDYVLSATRDYIPAGVNLIEEAAAEIDPVGRNVTTESGRRLSYDFLIVATGLHLDYAAIEADGLGDNPLFIRLMAAIGGEIGEAPLPGADGGMPSGVDIIDLMRKLQDPKNEKDPQRAEWQRKVDAYYKSRPGASQPVF